MQVSASNPDGTVILATAPSTAVSPAPPLNTLAPQITGAAQRTNVLTLSSTGTWTGPDNAYAYQWQRSTTNGASWSNISAAIAATYTLTVADEGAKIRALVIASNPDAPAGVSAASNQTGTVLSVPPANSALPSISGSAQRGQTLAATKGTWSGPDNTYAYQWQHSSDASTWTTMTAQTSASYTLLPTDVGSYIRVLVTATNPDAPAGVSATSVATSKVAAVPPQNTAPPSLSGPARLGGVLTANPGTWTPAGATFTYLWQRSADTHTWTTIAGASDQSYTLSAADVSDIVRVLITATNVDGSTSATSTASATVTQPPKNLTAPSAPNGTLHDSYALSADHGIWDTSAGVSFSYTWMRCAASASAVSGSCTMIGTGPSYMLQAADVGFTVGVSVSATSSGGTSDPVPSALSAVVSGRPLINTIAPSISGSPQIPGILSANPGSWSVATTAISFAWQRCDADGSSNCTQVSSSGQYALSSADAGHTLVLYVTATSPGQSSTAHSTALSITSQPLPQPTLAPTVTGTAQRTFTLSSTQGTWTNKPTLSSEWQRCDAAGRNCAAIAGATGQNYTLTQADEGHDITVQVTATNSSGSTVASAHPTDAVATFLPVIIHAPAVTGIAYEQDMQIGIVANSATWQTTAETTYAPSWQRCDAAGQNCTTIPGATSGLYTPTSGDVAHTLIALITATNTDGSVPSASKPTPVITDAGPRWTTLPLISADPGHVGDDLTITPGTWSGPKVDSELVQMMRCTNSCVATGQPNTATYTIHNADLGAILRVQDTATNQGGSVSLWSARYVGPVSSAAAGSAVLRDAASVRVRGSTGQTLATAQMQTLLGANAARAAAAKHPPARVLNLHRGHGVTGTLQAWVCPVPVGSAPPAKCSAKVTLRRAATMTLPASMSGKLRIVVVRRR